MPADHFQVKLSGSWKDGFASELDGTGSKNMGY